jgi:outer membrane protein assembly factor BamB
VLTLLGCAPSKDSTPVADQQEAASSTERLTEADTTPKPPVTDPSDGFDPPPLAGETEAAAPAESPAVAEQSGEKAPSDQRPTPDPPPAAEEPEPAALTRSPAAVEPSDEAATDPSAPFWPGFCGPHGNNVSTEAGLLKEWPEDGPALLWTARGIGNGYSTASLAHGLIYTAGNIDGNTVVTALDLDGQARWQVPAGDAWTKDYPGTRSTPTIDGNRLYYQNPLGELFCLTAATGEPVWRVQVLERFGAENIKWALAESSVIDGDHVISTPGGPNTAVVALNKMTGETVWQSESAAGDAAGYSTPTLAEYQGKRLIFTMTAKAIICVDADTGRLYWRFPHETSYDVNASKPIFLDGHVFISTGYGAGSRMLRVSVDGDQVGVEEVWANTDLDNHHGGVILLDGYLYGSEDRRSWVCLDWKTGRTMYNERGVGKGSLTSADGMLYTLSERGEMGLVPATPDGHQVVSQFSLPPGGEGRSWAYPVVIGGCMYIRHGDYLFCYDVRDPAAEAR